MPFATPRALSISFGFSSFLYIYKFVLKTDALAPIEVEILLCRPEASGGTKDWNG